jgi:glycosyltransferase 2 family protein
MKPKVILQYIFFFGLAIFMMWYATKDVNMQDLWQRIKNADVFYLILIIVIGIASIVFRAFRWQIQIEPIAPKPRFINTFLSTFIGYGVNFFTPRLGEVAKCAALARYENVSADKLAGTIVAERIFDMLCLLAIMLFTFVIEFDTLQPVIVQLQQKIASMLSGKIIAIGIIAILALIVAAIFALKKLKSADGSNKIIAIINNVKDGVFAIFKLKKRIQFILNSLGIWASYLGMTYFGFKGLPQISHLTMQAACSVLSIGSFGFILTPGGTGSYQLIVQKVLADFYNIETVSAQAYALMSWALQNGILLVGAFVAFIAFPIINRKK